MTSLVFSHVLAKRTYIGFLWVVAAGGVNVKSVIAPTLNSGASPVSAKPRLRPCKGICFLENHDMNHLESVSLAALHLTGLILNTQSFEAAAVQKHLPGFVLSASWPKGKVQMS